MRAPWEYLSKKAHAKCPCHVSFDYIYMWPDWLGCFYELGEGWNDVYALESTFERDGAFSSKSEHWMFPLEGDWLWFSKCNLFFNMSNAHIINVLERRLSWKGLQITFELRN